LKEKILDSIVDTGALLDYANQALLTSGQQIAFEVLGRKMLSHANATNKGGDFRLVFDFITELEEKVKNRGDELSVGMIALRVDLVIRWRLHKTRGPVDWFSLRSDLEHILASHKYRDDFIKMYYFGVALYHCDDITRGNVIFEKMRSQLRPASSVRRGIRNYYLGQEGFPRRLQGTLRVHHERYSVYIPELASDFYCPRPPSGSGNDATVHCYLAFSLNGPNAVFDAPTENELLLP
jgi:hypothetical protein